MGTLSMISVGDILKGTRSSVSKRTENSSILL
jgi:hypothetical protein